MQYIIKFFTGDCRLKVTSWEFWGKGRSRCGLGQRNHVSDQMIQQVKYVLCHCTSSKNAGNEYRYTVPRTAMFINKTNSSDEKENSKNGQNKKSTF